MKLKLPTPGTYGQTEADGTPEELADFFRALGKGQQAPLPISIPSVWSYDVCLFGGAHQYPAVWLGIFPPPCEKCGQAQASIPEWTVTWSDQVDPNFPCHTTIVTQTTSPAVQNADQPAPQGCTD